MQDSKDGANDLEARLRKVAEKIIAHDLAVADGRIPIPPLPKEEMDALDEALGAEEAARRRRETINAVQLEHILETMKPCAKYAVPLAVVRQHAVGHGGFHTGAIGVNAPAVRWVYDCGAWRKSGKAVLSEKIDVYRTRLGDSGRIDLLFLSHFDADHISGVEQLLDKTKVSTVVVPYLEPEEVFGVVLQGAAEGAAGDEILNLAQAALDPGAWFRDRGASRVIRLRPGAADDGVTSPGSMAPPASVAPGGFGVGLADRSGAALPVGDDLVAAPGLAGYLLQNDGSLADWAFLPFVHPVSDDALRQLRQAAKSLLDTDASDPLFPAKLLEKARTREGLNALRDLYTAEELADANARSLSLYAGAPYSGMRISLAERQPSHTTGWLLTGDAKLRNRERRAAWQRHYSRVGDLVSHLMIPHHGAVANFHWAVPRLAKHASLFVTADAKDVGLRPHKDVCDELSEHDDKREIARVSERIEAEICAVSGAPEYAETALIKQKTYANWT